MSKLSDDDICEECGSKNLEFYNDGLGRCLDCGKIIREKNLSSRMEKRNNRAEKDRKYDTPKESKPPKPPEPPTPPESKNTDISNLKNEMDSSQKKLEEFVNPSEILLSTLKFKNKKIFATNKRVIQYMPSSDKEILDLSYDKLSYVKNEKDIKTNRWVSVLGFILILYILNLPILPPPDLNLPAEMKFLLLLLGLICFFAGLLYIKKQSLLIFESEKHISLTDWRINLHDNIEEDEIKEFIKIVHAKIVENR